YDYLHSGDRALEEKILLHNRDDVLQLHRLLKLLEKVPLHQALFHLGFPVKGKNHKVLVEHIRIQKETLTLSGRQGPNPIRRVSFGDKGTAYDFAPGTFTLSLPLIVHQGLTFLDMEDFPFSLPGTVEGYLVLSGEDGPNYREINYFVKTLLERILNNEL
ncbi:MAG: hypothetical protein RR472_04390, partial [Anaerovoracaceae bacterium]